MDQQVQGLPCSHCLTVLIPEKPKENSSFVCDLTSCEDATGWEEILCSQNKLCLRAGAGPGIGLLPRKLGSSWLEGSSM